jgi:hypothetical protein
MCRSFFVFGRRRKDLPQRSQRSHREKGGGLGWRWRRGWWGIAAGARSQYTVTVTLNYDFSLDNACSATVTTACMKQFNIYDITGGETPLHLTDQRLQRTNAMNQQLLGQQQSLASLLTPQYQAMANNPRYRAADKAAITGQSQGALASAFDSLQRSDRRITGFARFQPCQSLLAGHFV